MDKRVNKQRRDFTPLIFSIDGIMGEAAISASWSIARLLAHKWGRSYSDVCGSMFIRNPRQGAPSRTPPTWENGTCLFLY